jgi:hypothetical protein
VFNPTFLRVNNAGSGGLPDLPLEVSGLADRCRSAAPAEEHALHVGRDGVDLGRLQHRLPGRHRGAGQAFADHLRSRAGGMLCTRVLGQVARLGLHELADPVLAGAVAAVAEGAVGLEQLLAARSRARQPFHRGTTSCLA